MEQEQEQQNQLQKVQIRKKTYWEIQDQEGNTLDQFQDKEEAISHRDKDVTILVPINVMKAVVENLEDLLHTAQDSYYFDEVKDSKVPDKLIQEVKNILEYSDKYIGTDKIKYTNKKGPLEKVNG